MSITYLLSVLRHTAAKQPINIEVFNVEAVRQQLQSVPNNHMSERGHRTQQQVSSTSLQFSFCGSEVSKLCKRCFIFISTHFIEKKSAMTVISLTSFS